MAGTARVGCCCDAIPDRAVLTPRSCTGLPPASTQCADRRVGQLWMASEAGRFHERRGHERQRATGAGPKHELMFTDRLIATLVILRFQLPHAALALFGIEPPAAAPCPSQAPAPPLSPPSPAASTPR